MKFSHRILLAHFLTLGLTLMLVGYWSYLEFDEQRVRFLHGGIKAVDEHSVLEETSEIVLLGGAPVLVLSILGGTLLMKRSLRSIVRLTEALEDTNVDNLSRPVPRSGNGDELDRMTVVFNDMKSRLGLAFTQAREFTLHASHELKTPLTIMHGTLEQMLAHPTDPKLSHDSVASMLEEVQRLSIIVGQLAFLAKADAGMLDVTLAPVAFDELVRDITEDAVILASSAAIDVTLSQCSPVMIQGDRMKLRQLLLNLADNAVKYNRPGGDIHLQLELFQARMVFTITNTGPSLPPDKQARVFERFFRGDPAHNSSSDSSGLGLSIAKSIVEAHRGDIRYEVLPNACTRVTVVLPVDPQA